MPQGIPGKAVIHGHQVFAGIFLLDTLACLAASCPCNKPVSALLRAL